MKIFKYPIDIDDTITVRMHKDARILHVDTQDGEPMLWAMIDPEMPLVDRVLYIRGTGHELGEARHANYIGTFQMAGGRLVWHVFDSGNQRQVGGRK